MMTLIKNLKTAVEIKSGLPGKYVWTGDTSYYLNGNSSLGSIHFRVSPHENTTFNDFHVTPQVLSGTNVGIWYKGVKWSNDNVKNWPSHEQSEREIWWAEHVKDAAKDFFEKVK